MEYRVYKGAKGIQVIVSKDEDLPSQGAPYQFVKGLTVNSGDGPRIGVGSDEIINNVSTKGYHVWPEGADADWT